MQYFTFLLPPTVGAYALFYLNTTGETAKLCSKPDQSHKYRHKVYRYRYTPLYNSCNTLILLPSIRSLEQRSGEQSSKPTKFCWNPSLSAPSLSCTTIPGLCSIASLASLEDLQSMCHQTRLLSWSMIIVLPSSKISQRNWGAYPHASVLALQLVLSCSRHA